MPRTMNHSREDCISAFVESQYSFDEGFEFLKNQGFFVTTSVLEKLRLGETSEQSPFGPKGFNGLYKIAYKLSNSQGLVGKDFSIELYRRANLLVDEYLTNEIAPKLSLKHGIFFLQEIFSLWENHQQLVKWLYKLFFHLDNCDFIRFQQNQPVIWSFLTSFGKNVFETHVEKFNDCLISEIDSLRNGKEENIELIGKSINLILTMGQYISTLKNVPRTHDEIKNFPVQTSTYVKYFEPKFLQMTKSFFHAWGEQRASELTPREYCAQVEAAAQQAEEHHRRTLHPSSAPQAQAIVLEALVIHNSEIFTGIFFDCLRECLLRPEGSSQGKEFVSRIFTLFKRADDLNPQSQVLQQLSEGFRRLLAGQLEGFRQERVEACAPKEGVPASKENADDPRLVGNHLQLLRSSSDLCTTSFCNHPLFLRTQELAFTASLNCPFKPLKFEFVDILAYFLDKKLKAPRGMLQASAADLELEDALSLLRFISDKDLFALNYTNHLCKRILISRDKLDVDLEKHVIGRLKMSYGAKFVDRMESMVQDIHISETVASNWREASGSAVILPLVLTKSKWPSNTTRAISCCLPPQLAEPFMAFSQWYRSEAGSGRLLEVLVGQGEVTLKASYARKSFEFLAYPIQAVVLLALSQGSGSLFFEEVRRDTGIDEEPLKKVLHSLCGLAPKTPKLVLKTPETNKMLATDSFRLSPSFDNPKKIIRLIMSSLEESERSVDSGLEDQRGQLVDAAIVRIMKARKILSHQELFISCSEQLRLFRLEPMLFKRRAEALVEREYLERDPQDHRLFRYLA